MEYIIWKYVRISRIVWYNYEFSAKRDPSIRVIYETTSKTKLQVTTLTWAGGKTQNNFYAREILRCYGLAF